MYLRSHTSALDSSGWRVFDSFLRASLPDQPVSTLGPSDTLGWDCECISESVEKSPDGSVEYQSARRTEALMVQHILNISDQDTIEMIRENLLIQYFLGFDSFTSNALSIRHFSSRFRKGREQMSRTGSTR